MANELNVSGMKIQPLDENQHLVYVLSEHEDGDALLNKGSLMNKRIQTRIVQKNMSEDEDYLYEDQDY